MYDDIDFYGHTHDDVLVTLPDRKMEGVAKALLSGIIFQKGVPLLFVNDEPKEFVDGLVHSVMNRYVGIMQITTGGIALDPTQTLNVSCSSI